LQRLRAAGDESDWEVTQVDSFDLSFNFLRIIGFRYTGMETRN
jgi:hypothetical protein